MTAPATRSVRPVHGEAGTTLDFNEDLDFDEPSCKVGFGPFRVMGGIMPKRVSGLLAGVAMGVAAISVASAADLGAVPQERSVYAECRPVRHCTREGCRWRHVCPRECPDRYSCSPLYGAYGPYGGVAYGTAYTSPGWDPR